jgi:hypothetical protein
MRGFWWIGRPRASVPALRGPIAQIETAVVTRSVREAVHRFNDCADRCKPASDGTPLPAFRALSNDRENVERTLLAVPGCSGLFRAKSWLLAGCSLAVIR